MADPFRITVVCTGNICRSPMAEAVLRDRFAAAGLGDRVLVDSRGVSAEEAGNPIDPRAARVLAAAGHTVPHHTARQVTRDELAHRDLVLAMTGRHEQRVRALAPSGADVRLWRSFDPAARGDLDVADPWYGDREAFEATLAQVEAAADGVVGFVRARLAPWPVRIPDGRGPFDRPGS